MKKNVIKDKSFDFAIKVVKLYKLLCKDRKEFVMSKQILRSGTSIGAMVRESEHAESKSDFIHKLSVALKEASETEYWLELLYEFDYVEKAHFISMKEDVHEVLKILTAIIKTSKLKNTC
jgi:four helix bundle protein